MFQNMSRRGRIRLLSFNIALIASLAILLSLSCSRSNFFKAQQSIMYQESLDQLDEYMENIQTSLHKGLYANTSPMVSNISAKLLKEASGAKGALSLLPVNDMNLENIYRFLSQVGEFSISLSNKMNTAQEISPDEHETLKQLAKRAAALSDQLSAMREGFDADSLVNEQLHEGNMNDVIQVSALNGFSDAEEALADFPTLVYDGPFSDHILQREALLLKNEKEVSREDARGIAAQFVGINTDMLADSEDKDGAVPCYCFKTDVIDISVSKQGGHVVSLLDSSYCGEITMSLEDAVNRAKQAMTDKGMTSFKETYYSQQDGICTVNFAYTENGVTYYTDLIKMGICMDDGEVVYYDALGYVMNHTARNLPVKKLTAEQAKGKLSRYLTVLDEGEAVIPTQGQNEVYCYEFHCKGDDGQEVLVYINAETGLESDILLLLYSDNGILSM